MGQYQFLQEIMIEEECQDNTRLVEWEYSQGGTYIQGASITQRREYPRESSEDDNINRRPYREWRAP